MNEFFSPRIYVGETLMHILALSNWVKETPSLNTQVFLINSSYYPAISPGTKHMSNNSGYLVIFGSVVMNTVNMQTRDLPINSELESF